MPASIGVNLRVTGNCRQGGRKYMEDFFSVAYQQTEDEKDLEYAFFGIFDGHGGAEAAAFAKEHLMETIIKHKNFWSDNDDDVLRAIKDGYIATHYAMWREQSKWPRTNSGLPSTAGTTASVAFIRRGKIYIGHVGDSGIILGYQEPGSSEWKARPLTKDHKPENAEEMKRIESCGGKVVSKSGVPRVVWNRPRIGHQGPVRRSTPIDEIPFLAVARSLGDLWSYNSQINQFIVSPDPDCSVLPIDANVHRCLIFGTDGLFNMLSPTMAVHIVQQAERHNECSALSDSVNKMWLNPSKLLVQHALDRWMATKMRADNTSVVTLMLDPPGPPRAQVLKDRKKNLPESGLKIMTRYDESVSPQSPTHITSKNVQKTEYEETTSGKTATPETLVTVSKTDVKDTREEENITQDKSIEKCDKALFPEPNSNISISSSDISSNFPLLENSDKTFVPKLRESTSFDPRETLKQNVEPLLGNKDKIVLVHEDNTIQINEVSSSNIEDNVLEEDKVSIDCEEQKPQVRTKKGSKSIDVEKKKLLKRKVESDENTQRKSMRLSLNQKSLIESKKPAPCTLAEEKLKKLAEEAEKVKLLKEISEEKDKKHSRDRKGTTLSITQRFLKSKKIHFKKKISKDPLNKKKIKMGLQSTLIKSTRKSILKLNIQVKKGKSNSVKNIKNVTKIIKGSNKKDKNKKQKQISPNTRIKRSDKVIAGKLSTFKRQSLKTSSIKSKDANTRTGRALKNVIENGNKKSDKKIQKTSDNGNAKSSLTKESVLIENKSKRNSRGNKDIKSNVFSKRETRSSMSSCRRSVRSIDANKESNAKENITPKGAKVSPAQKKCIQQESAKKDTLRQRIQNKTKVLKKTVLRK
ncbi:hypothetical protein GWI33_004673 [Rhynchophorus ferrugineus]|uniref:PPM-type phosphatase domain-containing protein n=1 Tax=Rhynchophorus ferrugineus TaxID=354439 RepID=A0A834IUH6_RHYFE|nr:hypothetical protein GWI33_004673 [Rhynchophorus ferrugineus]